MKSVLTKLAVLLPVLACVPACGGSSADSESVEDLTRENAIAGTYELFVGGTHALHVPEEMKVDGEAVEKTYFPENGSHVGTMVVDNGGKYTLKIAKSSGGTKLLKTPLTDRKGKLTKAAGGTSKVAANVDTIEPNEKSNRAWLKLGGVSLIAERIKTGGGAPLYSRRCLAILVHETLWDEAFTEWEYPDFDVDGNTDGSRFHVGIGGTGTEYSFTKRPDKNGNLNVPMSFEDDHKLRLEVTGKAGILWQVDDPKSPIKVATLECGDPAKP